MFSSHTDCKRLYENAHGIAINQKNMGVSRQSKCGPGGVKGNILVNMVLEEGFYLPVAAINTPLSARETNTVLIVKSVPHN